MDLGDVRAEDWNRQIDPERPFDPIVPLNRVAEGYCAVDKRRAIKALPHP